jgi:hypothetical protein
VKSVSVPLHFSRGLHKRRPSNEREEERWERRDESKEKRERSCTSLPIGK